MGNLLRKGFSGRYGDWAMVAGAAEGIGTAFSTFLAQNKINLIMIDFKTEPMHDLAEKFRSSFGIEIIELGQDLSAKEASIHCMEIIKSLDCRLLIYVPAFSQIKKFLDNSPDELDRYIELNCWAPLQMVHSFSKTKNEHKPLGIILMSSLAGLIGPPYSAPYAATKAFNIVLSESLYSELKQKDIDITVCCAGPTSTPTFWESNPILKGNWPGVMDPLDVADFALKNLGKNAVCIPGWKNRISYFLLTRLLPRSVAAKLVNDAIGKIYPDILTG